MSAVGQPERATQNRVIALFLDELGYRYFSDIDAKIAVLKATFAEVFPEKSIVSALRRQSAWTHFKQIIYLDDPLKRDFYAEMCRIEE